MSRWIPLILSIFTALVASRASASRGDLYKIQCEGYVTFQTGTMQGRIQVVLQQSQDGRWELNEIPAGSNLSRDPGRLILRTPGEESGPTDCDEVSAEYDLSSKVLKFQYTYSSQLLGGFCQKASGRFRNCKDQESN